MLKLTTNTKHRAASLRQLSFLLVSITEMSEIAHFPLSVCSSVMLEL